MRLFSETLGNVPFSRCWNRDPPEQILEIVISKEASQSSQRPRETNNRHKSENIGGGRNVKNYIVCQIGGKTFLSCRNRNNKITRWDKTHVLTERRPIWLGVSRHTEPQGDASRGKPCGIGRVTTFSRRVSSLWSHTRWISCPRQWKKCARSRARGFPCDFRRHSGMRRRE